MELRRHSRKPIVLSLELAIEGREQTLKARSRDLSLGGMFIETDTPPDFGTKLEITVQFPGTRRPFTLNAIVRWTAKDGVGVQFGPMGAHETHAIVGATQEPEEL